MTITIEEGKFYTTREGRKVGPIRKINSRYVTPGHYWGVRDNDHMSNFWYAEGCHLRGQVTDDDLVAEWVDPVEEPCPAQAAVEGLPEPFTHGDVVPPAPNADRVDTIAQAFAFNPVKQEQSDTIAYTVDNWKELKGIYDQAAAEAAPDIKAEIADEAKRIVSGARRSAYGKPEDNFERISAFWTAYAKAKGWPIEFTAADISPLMILMKLARIVESPSHRDSFVDVVGYALTGAEVNQVKSDA